jgi:hypothetical protein
LEVAPPEKAAPFHRKLPEGIKSFPAKVYALTHVTRFRRVSTFFLHLDLPSMLLAWLVECAEYCMRHCRSAGLQGRQACWCVEGHHVGCMKPASAALLSCTVVFCCCSNKLYCAGRHGFSCAGTCICFTLQVCPSCC